MVQLFCMTDIEQRGDKFNFRKFVPSAVILSLGATAGFSASEIIDLRAEDSTQESNTYDVAEAAKLLDNVPPCEDDPLEVIFNGKTSIVVDGRCRPEINEGNALVMSVSNEATLGPIASVESGTLLEAICSVEGQSISSAEGEFESDKWIKVRLASEEGVEFMSNKGEGFINSLEVIAESSLPSCSTDDVPITA